MRRSIIRCAIKKPRDGALFQQPSYSSVLSSISLRDLTGSVNSCNAISSLLIQWFNFIPKHNCVFVLYATRKHQIAMTTIIRNDVGRWLTLLVMLLAHQQIPRPQLQRCAPVNTQGSVHCNCQPETTHYPC